MFRRANIRTRKSFSVFTLTRLMKNWSRYSLLLVVTSRPVLDPKKNSGCLSQARLIWENEASWCAKYFISLYLELGIADGGMFMSRPSQSSRPWGAYSMGGSALPCARQTNPTLSPLKTGDHSNSIFGSVFPPSPPIHVLVTDIEPLESTIRYIL